MAEKRIHTFFDKSMLYLTYLFIAFSLFTIAGTQMTLSLIVLIWIGRMIYARRFLVQRTPLDMAFLLFVVACVVATVFSLRPVESLFNLKNLLLISVVYVIASVLQDKKRIVAAINIFVITATVVAAIGLMTTDLMSGQRVMPFQSTTMTWGAMSTVFMLITLALFMFAKAGGMRWLYLICFVVQLLSLLFSYVRGAWVGFFAGVLLLVMMKSKKLIALVLLLLLLVVMLAPASVQDRIVSIVDLNVGSTQVRFMQWTNSLQIFLDHPVTGVGWIDLSTIHKRYAPPGADLDHQAYNIGHFHNNYVMFYVCLGAFGFVAALYLMYKLLRTEYRLYQTAADRPGLERAWVAGSFAAMAGFWVNGFFDWTFGDAEPVTLLWFSVGMVLAIGSRTSAGIENEST